MYNSEVLIVNSKVDINNMNVIEIKLSELSNIISIELLVRSN